MRPLRLRDDMQAIVDHMKRGGLLIGPVTVRQHRYSRSCLQMRPWGFADGRPASKRSVDALAARGLIRIAEDEDGHVARLIESGITPQSKHPCEKIG